jgi:superfamily II DNA/RNA helicase
LTVYGGVDIYAQMQELRRGVDIFVGTTGRVKDHMERKNFDFT